MKSVSSSEKSRAAGRFRNFHQGLETFETSIKIPEGAAALPTLVALTYKFQMFPEVQRKDTITKRKQLLVLLYKSWLASLNFVFHSFLQQPSTGSPSDHLLGKWPQCQQGAGTSARGTQVPECRPLSHRQGQIGMKTGTHCSNQTANSPGGWGVVITPLHNSIKFLRILRAQLDTSQHFFKRLLPRIYYFLYSESKKVIWI